MSQVTLLVKLQAKSGKEEDLLRELTAMIEPSRKESGCIQYDLNRAPDNREIFWFVEKWASQAALDEHNKTPHYLQLQQTIGDLLEEAERVTLEPVRD